MRQRQNGSMQSFVVVGVILFVLCGGLFYAIGHRDKGGEIAKTNTPEIKVTFPEVKTTTEKQKSSAPPSSTPAAEPSSNDEVTPMAAPRKLPVTGPTSQLSSIVSAGLLAGAGVAYVSARRTYRDQR